MGPVPSYRLVAQLIGGPQIDSVDASGFQCIFYVGIYIYIYFS